MQEVYTEFKNTPAEFKMVYVKGGVFEMGSNATEAYDNEKPVHKVKVSDFWMGEFAVTQEVWAHVMIDQEKTSYFKGASHPVESVSYKDAVTGFLPKLNSMTGLEYRLPTEVEWEYAARGGKYSEKYPFTYAGSNKLEEVGWYNENSHSETKRAGLKTSNLLGLYDLSGNVWEWCSNGENNIDSLAERELFRGTFKYRGGGWIDSLEKCHLTRCTNDFLGIRIGYVGFRLVLSSLA